MSLTVRKAMPEFFEIGDLVVKKNEGKDDCFHNILTSSPLQVYLEFNPYDCSTGGRLFVKQDGFCQSFCWYYDGEREEMIKDYRFLCDEIAKSYNSRQYN